MGWGAPSRWCGDGWIRARRRLAAGIADRLPRGHLEEHPELGHFGPLEALAPMAGSIRSTVTPAA